MKTNENVKLAMLAGEIMLRNGAESFRIEDTLNRILKKFQYKVVESFTTTTGIFISVEDEDGEVTTLVKRVHKRTINLNKIASVNDLSRRIVEGRINTHGALIELEEINKRITYNNIEILAGWSLSCLGFTYILDNSINDGLAAFIVGVFSYFFSVFLEKKNASSVASNFSVAVFLTALSIIVHKVGIGENVDNMIIGGIMPLVPGVASVNCIRDMLSGDYLAASSRLLDVVLVLVCISLGVGLSLKVGIMIFGGV